MSDLDDPAAPDAAPTPSPGGSKRKRGHKLPPKERAVRGEMILARKLTGHKMEAIAAEFHISQATAYRALGQARRDGIYEQAKDFIHARLLPKALAVYDQALDEMNVEVARDVLQGLGITGRAVQVSVKHEVKEDFDNWRLAKSKALDAQITEVAEPDAPHSTDHQATPASAGGDVPAAGTDGDEGEPAEPEDPEGTGSGNGEPSVH